MNTPHPKEQTSRKKVAEKAMEEARKIVDLEAETVKIGEKQHSNWKVA